MRNDGDVNNSAERAREYPRVTSFRFRRGSLTTGQQRNWETLWPQLGVDILTADTKPDGPLDLEALFGRQAPTVLEIGSGTGISTAAMAAAEPDVDVLAVEVYRPGLAQLVGLVDRNGLTNVRMIRGDATVVLTELIRPASLTGIRLFFPDPWPKSRHHKRRFVQSGTLELMADRLIGGGVLHIATDHAGYAEWIAEKLATQDPAGHHVVQLTGASPISLDRPTTKFEGRAEREGRDVNEFVYTRPVPRGTGPGGTGTGTDTDGTADDSEDAS
ncbi:tRNA (guanine-N(7)-)-methyltransferase [Gordonia bronchialis DSM 43247]|uniref:tRNA (guanine-N(7)-)-methyltransferase n=1 Tax=Gordonia bronchialis (strain ATCC 25592 / DSM 43247 / BCRC 13721 / JCM 3198 / KCTC 3076 / NBRC 16047 / NCTC 10667) TaxID=526226 RepID=D0L6Q2_GORB4|nr:tRNA (guanosine(46)-N7)-methyltransferase TrmB [Gordonia bronchialis]ACY23612.1 tRNA (guanine-N(7)-)-methyltransferase [Gordonia bronchialis DSM 43247]MCC3321781.1 tRNA (guanosine(46)-N7)-methyltransferase TrmB [Gordonia bronchialis]QGS23047.1 tRNA (guanosine(46)-N7)-methyltransferase TrmB [Gordonia bronchialis]STQ66622.1 tRNA (guanine-N(7)-)-methyltransferase [Gordonia bronchialis]